jgi:hypothetical protein
LWTFEFQERASEVFDHLLCCGIKSAACRVPQFDTFTHERRVSVSCIESARPQHHNALKLSSAIEVRAPLATAQRSCWRSDHGISAGSNSSSGTLTPQHCETTDWTLSGDVHKSFHVPGQRVQPGSA